MLKKRSEKILALGIVLFLIFVFLTCFSMIQFPFLNPRSSLNEHLTKDFGVMLPASGVIEESYWVGARDPENVFKIQIEAKELGGFMDAIRAAAKARNYTEQDGAHTSRFGPLYRIPSWWNAPPLPDAVKLEFSVPIIQDVEGNYRFIYSPSTGKLYLVWGAN